MREYLLNRKVAKKLYFMLEPIILMSSKLAVHQEDMNDAKKRKIILYFYFGWIWYAGGHYGLGREPVRLVTTRVFKELFQVDHAEVIDFVDSLDDSEDDDEVRRYVTEGAMAIEPFIDAGITPSTSRLIDLLKEV